MLASEPAGGDVPSAAGAVAELDVDAVAELEVVAVAELDVEAVADAGVVESPAEVGEGLAVDGLLPAAAGDPVVPVVVSGAAAFAWPLALGCAVV